MSELKPCPFCGSTRQELTYSLSINTERTYYGNGIICANCRVCVPEDEWDTRPIEDALQSRIDKLEEALAKVEEYATEEQGDWAVVGEDYLPENMITLRQITEIAQEALK